MLRFFAANRLRVAAKNALVQRGGDVVGDAVGGEPDRQVPRQPPLAAAADELGAEALVASPGPRGAPRALAPRRPPADAGADELGSEALALRRLDGGAARFPPVDAKPRRAV